MIGPVLLDQWTRRAKIAALALALIGTFTAAYLLNAKEDPCDVPLDDVAEAVKIDRPECADGGAR